MPKVFVSWSGPRGKELAETLKETVLTVPGVEAWVSSQDIVLGSEWFASIKTQLTQADGAIICLTPEAIDSPWVHFEAGALWARLSDVKVLLFGVDESDLRRSPISQIQLGNGLSEKDVVRLMAALPDMPPAETIRQHVRQAWPTWMDRSEHITAPWSFEDQDQEILQLSRAVLSSFSAMERQFRVFQFKLYSEVHSSAIHKQGLPFNLALNGFLRMRSDAKRPIRTAYDASLLFWRTNGRIDLQILEEVLNAGQRVLNLGLEVGLYGRFEPWDTFLFLILDDPKLDFEWAHVPYVNVYLVGRNRQWSNRSPHYWMDEVLAKVCLTWPPGAALG